MIASKALSMTAMFRCYILNRTTATLSSIAFLTIAKVLPSRSGTKWMS